MYWPSFLKIPIKVPDLLKIVLFPVTNNTKNDCHYHLNGTAKAVVAFMFLPELLIKRLNIL